MSGVSVNSERFATPHDSNFLRSVRQMCAYRPHLSGCNGSESLKRKKRSGERPIRYNEVIAFIRNARRDAARKGAGAEMVAALVNDIIKDTLPEGAPLDAIARPADSDSAPIGTRKDEELGFCVAASQLITAAERAVNDGILTLAERQQLTGALRAVRTCGDRLIAELENETRGKR